MTATEPLPVHVEKLLSCLRDLGPITLDDNGLFEVWKRTDLSDIDIVAGLDFLAITGSRPRSPPFTVGGITSCFSD